MFAAGAERIIEGAVWRVAAHPSAPQSPWSRVGGTSVVYRLEGAGGPRALKAFEAAWRGTETAERAERLGALRDAGGLRAAERRIVPLSSSGGHPGTGDALWMPWIEGYAWGDVVRVRTALTPEQSLHLARALVLVLARLESRGMAHCNLSGESVMITATAVPAVELVDLEHFYMSGLSGSHPPSKGAPALVRGGLPLCEARADRFAGAMLLAEILGWCDAAVRGAATGTCYFESEDFLPGPWPARARLLHERLAAVWGGSLAALFEHAWNVAVPTEAPDMSTWAAALAQASPAPAPVPLVPPAPSPSVSYQAPSSAPQPPPVSAWASPTPTALRMGGAASSRASLGGGSRVALMTTVVLLALIGVGGFVLLRWRSSAGGAPVASSSPSSPPAASSVPPSPPAASSVPPSPAAAPVSPGAAPSAVPSSAPGSDADGPGSLREVVMCRRVDAGGRPVQPVHTYDPFSPFFCSMRVPAGHDAAEVKATWRDPQGGSRSTTATVGSDGESYAYVTLTPADGAWIMGPYSLVLSVPGTPDKEVRFSVSATGR